MPKRHRDPRRESHALQRREPNLFIIGAPRAGTTFLYHALSRANGVYMSPVKEPAFFNSDRAYAGGLDYYLDACFARAAGYRIRGEATPWYLYSAGARKRIGALDLAEPPKSIVAIRRPSARALSMYRARKQIGRETRTFEAAIAAELEGFERGDLVEDVRERYLWCGRYREPIEAWQREFGAENLLVVVFDSFIVDPAATWVELASFLGQELGDAPFGDLSDHDKNPAGDLRWPRLHHFLQGFEGRNNPFLERAKRILPPGLHRRVLQQLHTYNLGKAPTEHAPADSSLMRDLDALFEIENDRLGALIGKDLSCWAGADPQR